MSTNFEAHNFAIKMIQNSLCTWKNTYWMCEPVLKSLCTHASSDVCVWGEGAQGLFNRFPLPTDVLTGAKGLLNHFVYSP